MSETAALQIAQLTITVRRSRKSDQLRVTVQVIDTEGKDVESIKTPLWLKPGDTLETISSNGKIFNLHYDADTDP